MNEVNSISQAERKSAIRKGLPINECGLTFYPIKMANYEAFLQCKDALTLRQASLPVRYLSKDYMSALFALDIDSVKEGKQCAGLFIRALRLAYMSMRIDYNKSNAEKNIQYGEKHGEIIIESLLFSQNDGEIVKITPHDFSFKIRPLIAEQNGIDLPDESENTELVESNEQQKKLKGGNQNLNVNVDDLIASVAYQSKIHESEIDDWTVREFENRKKAIERDKRYMLYGQAELSGMVTFKNGNPASSWCFDSIDDSLGTMSMGEFKSKISGVSEKTE